MKANDPVVSIIVPMYNSEKFVAETIQSVLNQTFTSWELLLIDDGSTDQTKNIAQSFLGDKRIKYIYQSNKGTANARNAGIKVARGKYLAMIDADDLWEPHKLQLQIDVLKREKVSLVFSVLRRVDENGAPLGRTIGSGEGIFDGFSTLFLLIAGSISIPNSSVVVKKKWVNKVDNYDDQNEAAHHMEDYDLLFRLLTSGATFYGVNEILGSYRRHADQITHQDSAQNLLMIDYLGNLIAKYPEKKAFLKFLILLRLSSFYWQHDNKREARKICLDTYHANVNIDRYWFDKHLIKVFSLENYLRLRRLIIRKFRRFNTFVELLDE